MEQNLRAEEASVSREGKRPMTGKQRKEKNQSLKNNGRMNQEVGMEAEQPKQENKNEILSSRGQKLQQKIYRVEI